jgi:hypothetical protein
MDQALMEHLIPGVVRVESQALDGASHCTYVIESIPASGESA